MGRDKRLQHWRIESTIRSLTLWEIVGWAGCVILVAFFLVSAGTVRDALFALFELLALAGLVVGLRRNKPTARLAWWLFVASQLIWTAGDLVNRFFPENSQLPHSSLAPWDAIYLIGYPFFLAALICWLHRQYEQSDWGGLVDVLIATVAAGLILWVVVIAPRFAQGEAATDRLRVVAYPILDLLALAFVLRLFFGVAQRSVPLLFLVAGTVLLPLADLVYGLDTISDIFRSEGVGDLFWLFSVLAFALTALHPDMDTIGAPPARPRPTWRRLAVLALAALAGPLVLIVNNARGLDIDHTVLDTGTNLLFFLAMIRGAIVVGQVRVAYRRTTEILESIGDGFLALDHEWRFTYLNQTAESLLQRPERDLIGKVIWQEFAPLNDLELGRALRRSKALRETVTAECFFPPLNAWLDVRAYPSGDGLSVYIREVSARHRAEQQLRESEERLRLALEAAGIGAWDWHIPTDEVAWSRTLVSLVGLTQHPESMTSHALRARFVHPDDHDRSTRDAPILLTGDDFAQIEYRLIRADGTVRWFVDVGRVVERAYDGSPIRSAGITADITTLRATSEALELRDRALEGSSSGVVIINALESDQPIVDVNPAFERMTGYDRATIVGRNLLTLAHPEADPASLDTIRALSAEEWQGVVTLHCSRQDGSSFWAELRCAPVHDQDGRLTHLVGILNDVSEQRWAEEELRVRSALLDQATVSVLARDPSGIVTHWNRQAETLFGWSRAEAIGRLANELLVRPVDIPGTADIGRRVLSGERWEGEIILLRKDGSEVSVYHHDSPVYNTNGQLVAVVGVSVDLTERKAFENQLAYQASHDALTGLPNRLWFSQHLEQALADEVPVVVLFLDLDGFKRVNDSLGHAAGDQLLIAVGDRLESLIEPPTRLARFGGDEFTLLLPGVSTGFSAGKIASRLLDGLRSPFLIDDHLEAFIGASIGVACRSATLRCADDLMRAADVALYQAKAAGRSTYRVFEPLMAERATHNLELESDLRRAVERGELRLHYQPEFDLRTGAIIGAEALIRWQHPRRGLLAPGIFIPIAEESDLIVSIGNWVLDEACRQFGEWQQCGFTRTQLTVSVNLTARQIQHPEIVRNVMRAVDRAGLKASQLKLEITERAIVEDADTESGALAWLRQLGVKLAIDDFGTGYSSLGYLRRWPVDTLKIDRSFVTGIEHDAGSQQLVAAMTALAHALGADVTAEGIETAEQLNRLQRIGVDHGQGFYFAPALPPDAFVHRLNHSDQFLLSSADPAKMTLNGNGPSLR